MSIFDFNKKSLDQVKSRLADTGIPLPLDDFIRGLSERTRRPILRDVLPSPIEFARHSTARAFFQACLNIGARQLTDYKARELRLLHKRMKSLQPRMGDTINHISRLRDAHSAFEEFDFVPFAKLEDALLRALWASEAAETLSKNILRARENVGRVWKLGFVSGLFDPWRELTGGTPQPKGPFLEFVQSAWLSLAPNQRHEDFESAIKTAKTHISR